MKKYIIENKMGISIVASIIAFFAIYSMISTPNVALQTSVAKSTNTSNKVVKQETPRIITEEEILNMKLTEKDLEIHFYSNCFQIAYDTLINLLKENYVTLDLLNDNINFDLVLINYLLELEDTNKDLFDRTINPYQGNSAYVVGLIKYFTNIYNIVDFNIASAIAQIESGYSAPSMLRVNNIYGGMNGNGNLIKYKNIEYGVLRYIKLLNDGYFSKGLTTVEAIGVVYNPRFDANGNKIASPSWVSKVNNALYTYEEYQSIQTLSEVISLAEEV